ncbi:hypothetical protein GCM10027447_01620 [Glycomyces halotolerans]
MTAQDPYRPQMQPPPQGWQQQPYGAQAPHAQWPAHPAPGYQPHSVQWPPMAVPAPAMVDGFMLVQPRLKPIPSGPAIGSLVAGIGGIVAAFPGLISAAFSPWAGLTFFMLAGLLGVGSIVLGAHARRQIKTSGGGVSGRGLALSGLILGIIASSLAGLTGLISLFAI